MGREGGFYADFEETFVRWAEAEEDIRAAFLIGSRARADHPADLWSDMDILLFARNPEKYLESADWLSRFGRVESSFRAQTAGGDPERLTLFDGGFQVDVVAHPFEALERIAEKGSIPDNFFRGVRVLMDKDGLGARILPGTFAAPKARPVAREPFETDIRTFWFLAVYLAKQILRGDLWVAKARDADMKALLLRMMEWREKAVRGEEYDTWHAGRFLREWASPAIYERLPETFGRFRRDESWTALEKTCDLYRLLSREVAARADFDANEALADFVIRWMAEHAPAGEEKDHAR